MQIKEYKEAINQVMRLQAENNRLKLSLKRKCDTINKLRQDVDRDYLQALHTELDYLRQFKNDTIEAWR